MTLAPPPPGALMRAEAAEAPQVFCRALDQDVVLPQPGRPLRAIYTVARGSSDAAALILAYEFMARLGVPVTSLPPSVFSLGGGVALDGADVLLISQSGASDDLVRSAKGARAAGARVSAITNVPGSPVEAGADLTLGISAGPERAVPATKSVIGSIAAGMALLRAFDPGYGPECAAAAAVFGTLAGDHPQAAELTSALLRAQHVYVIGRRSGLGAAQEIALKLKETCALHAEAHSASEVLHGPLQLVTRPLTVLILDTGDRAAAESLDTAEARFRAAGSTVWRLRPSDLGVAGGIAAPAAAAVLLYALYPVILSVALALGYNPDRPDQLAKVTRTT